MEKHLDKAKTAYDSTATPTALQTWAANHQAEASKLHQGTTYGDKATMDKFPSAQDLLGELNKEAHDQMGQAKYGYEKADISKTADLLNRDLKNLKPEDLKLAAQVAQEIQSDKAQGKSTAHVLDELREKFKNEKFPGDKARLIWNAAMLGLAHEQGAHLDMLHHVRGFDPPSFVHDPFMHVQLGDQLLH